MNISHKDMHAYHRTQSALECDLSAHAAEKVLKEFQDGNIVATEGMGTFDRAARVVSVGVAAALDIANRQGYGRHYIKQMLKDMAAAI